MLISTQFHAPISVFRSKNAVARCLSIQRHAVQVADGLVTLSSSETGFSPVGRSVHNLLPAIAPQSGFMLYPQHSRSYTKTRNMPKSWKAESPLWQPLPLWMSPKMRSGIICGRLSAGTFLLLSGSVSPPSIPKVADLLLVTVLGKYHYKSTRRKPQPSPSARPTSNGSLLRQ